MTTDTEWTWTILLRGGKSWHLPKAVTIWEAIRWFEKDGFHDAQIEAIIRH